MAILGVDVLLERNYVSALRLVRVCLAVFDFDLRACLGDLKLPSSKRNKKKADLQIEYQ
jgi:hypothetical protein